MSVGKAYIIGCGPGSEELLTLKAIRVLKECTVVLYDRLAGKGVLQYLNDNCQIYYCGKEPGAHYKSQEEINSIILKFAMEGHIVGRIKGGDPYVFGRGGEEIKALNKYKIPFEVIPGITSPISVLNYAGIPVTHRGYSHSFHIVTGTTAGEEKINWEALSKEEGTLIFLMGINKLEYIIEKLIENGKKVDSKVAVVMRGTTSKQKTVCGTLENISLKVRKASLQSPCIIVVGETVSLREELNWYEKKELFGKNICLCREKENNSTIKERILSLGGEVTEIKGISIVDKSDEFNRYIDNIEDYNHILFTSKNGVKLFFDKLIKERIDVRRLKAKISVLGEGTGKELTKRGLFYDYIGESYVAEGLFKSIEKHISKGDKVLIPTSSLARNYLKESLEKLGATVDRINIYDVVSGIKEADNIDEVDIILFTSPSIVDNIINEFSKETIEQKKLVAIGPITEKRINEYGLSAVVCEKATEEEIINTIKDL